MQRLTKCLTTIISPNNNNGAAVLRTVDGSYDNGDSRPLYCVFHMV